MSLSPVPDSHDVFESAEKRVCFDFLALPNVHNIPFSANDLELHFSSVFHASVYVNPIKKKVGDSFDLSLEVPEYLLLGRENFLQEILKEYYRYTRQNFPNTWETRSSLYEKTRDRLLGLLKSLY